MSALISSLIQHSSTLASLLRDAADSPPVYERVEKVVEQVLTDLKNPHVPASFPEDIIPKVLKQVQLTLEKFIKLDTVNSSKYQDLAKKINDFKPKKQSSAPRVPQLSDLPTDYSTQSDDDDHQFEVLTSAEKKCLACFCLISAGMVINRRELIYWWIGMDLLDPLNKADDFLAKFVEQKLIERTIGNKRLCNSFKMNENVRSKLVNQEISSFGSITEEGRWSVVNINQEQPRRTSSNSRLRSLSGITQQDGDSEKLMLNTKENSLNDTTMERVYKMKNNVKVLYLGCWDHNPKRYIVVEDVETLKGLRHMVHLTCLSLRGISGIVELPESVYKLEHLKILDMRGCPNLESLPEGIESLEKLTHLDLSECYLLEHIPQGIALLNQLTVLKGFVANPEDSQVLGNDKKKERNASSSSALFSDLSNLKELIKLTIRCRRMNFPTIQDFDTLFAMKKLTSLGIAWVWSSDTAPCAGAAGSFPKTLKKLKLQAAPDNTLLCLLRLISRDAEISLQKLCIRGGRLEDISMDDMHYFCNVQTVYLRYLPNLHIHWDEFRRLFPKLTRLEVLECPNLIFFPCDKNGVWEETKIY